MANYLRTLKITDVFQSRSIDSSIIRILSQNEYKLIISEKLRKGIIWVEFLIDDKASGFVKKEKSSIFICRHCELKDERIIGFNYKIKNNEQSLFNEIFDANKIIEVEDISFANIERITKFHKGNKEYISFKYDKNFAQVSPYILDRKDNFYIINDRIKGVNGLMEIDNFEGLNGVAPANICYAETKDMWETYFIMMIGIFTIIMITLIFLKNNLIVISSFMLIPGVIVGIVVLFLFKLLLKPLKTVFYQIQIRI